MLPQLSSTIYHILNTLCYILCVAHANTEKSLKSGVLGFTKRKINMST